MQHILDFMTTTFEEETLRDVDDRVPDGWKELVDLAFFLSASLSGSFRSVTKVHVEKGLLRIRGDFHNPTSQIVFDKFVQGLARDSSTTCMECGKRGFRRKEEEGWPSLCGVHYVEYVNFLDSKNRG